MASGGPIRKKATLCTMQSASTENNREDSFYGRVIVLKRDGQDSVAFDLCKNIEKIDSDNTGSSYIFGSGILCDVRIQLANVSENHCRVFFDQGNVSFTSEIYFNFKIRLFLKITVNMEPLLMEKFWQRMSRESSAVGTS